MIVNSIFKAYKKREVLKGVSFDFLPGEIIGLIGENGSGKTTIIRIISGITSPQKGSVIRKEKICALIEQPSFYLNLSGRDNIEYYLNRTLTVEEINNALFDCKKYVDLPVRKYSMGMRQKLALWMMILSDVDMLILDEPFVALDVESIHQLHNILLDCKKQGKGIFISGHNFSELQNLCDRVLVLSEGIIKGEIKNKNYNQVYKVRIEDTIVKKDYLLKYADKVSVDCNIIYVYGDEEMVSSVVKETVMADIKVFEITKMCETLEDEYKKVISGGNNEKGI